MNRDEIIQKAREYLKTPYHHQGRVKGHGIDCVGLVSCVASELGYEHEDYLNYSLWPDGKTLHRLLTQNGLIDIEIEEAVPGDLYLFTFMKKKRWPQHMAIITDIGILHTHSRSDKGVIETQLDDNWRRRIVGAMRFPIED